jgi:hypothetical protein
MMNRLSGYGISATAAVTGLRHPELCARILWAGLQPATASAPGRSAYRGTLADPASHPATLSPS